MYVDSSQPGMLGHGGETDPECRVHRQAARDQTLHLLTELQLWEPGEFGASDVRVTLEGHVSTDHVVEQDTEGPDCQLLGSVGTVGDPLGGRVHSSALELPVDLILQEGARPKVNQLDLEGVEVDEDVLILDVPVHHSLLVAGDHSVQQLLEQVLGEVLRQGSLLADEVKQVLAVETLHDDVEAVLHVEVVDDPDDPRDCVQVLHESHLQGEIVCPCHHSLVLADLLHCHLQSISASHCRVDQTEASLPDLVVELVLRLEVLPALLRSSHRSGHVTARQTEKFLQLHLKTVCCCSHCCVLTVVLF